MLVQLADFETNPRLARAMRALATRRAGEQLAQRLPRPLQLLRVWKRCISESLEGCCKETRHEIPRTVRKRGTFCFACVFLGRRPSPCFRSTDRLSERAGYSAHGSPGRPHHPLPHARRQSLAEQAAPDLSDAEDEPLDPSPAQQSGLREPAVHPCDPDRGHVLSGEFLAGPT